jgi:mannose-6-phosphate isomerase
LIACELFALEGLAIDAARTAATDPGSFEILTVVEGSVTLTSNGNALQLRRGDSVVLPAALGAYTLAPGSDDSPARLLRAYVPDLERDIVHPLQAQGIQPEQIAASVAR